jgi:hypothetical protein
MAAPVRPSEYLFRFFRQYSGFPYYSEVFPDLASNVAPLKNWHDCCSDQLEPGVISVVTHIVYCTFGSDPDV